MVRSLREDEGPKKPVFEILCLNSTVCVEVIEDVEDGTLQRHIPQKYHQVLFCVLITGFFRDWGLCPKG